MKLITTALVCIAALAIPFSTFASSNASVQKGKLSLEGAIYSGNFMGLSGELGVTNDIAIVLGNADIIPSLQAKIALPGTDKNTSLAFTGGLILDSYASWTIGLTGHHKINSTTRLFGDVSIGDWDFGYRSNVAVGLAYNITKQAAITAQFRKVHRYAGIGIGGRFTF